MDAVWHPQLLRGVPSGAVEDQGDEAVGPAANVLGEFLERDGARFGGDCRQQQPERVEKV